MLPQPMIPIPTFLDMMVWGKGLFDAAGDLVGGEITVAVPDGLHHVAVKAVELNRDILGVTDGPRGGEQIDLALAGRTEGNGVADHDAAALGLGFLEGGRFGDDAVLEMENLAARTDFLDERRRIESGAGDPEHVGLVEHRFRSV